MLTRHVYRQVTSSTFTWGDLIMGCFLSIRVTFMARAHAPWHTLLRLDISPLCYVVKLQMSYSMTPLVSILTQIR